MGKTCAHGRETMYQTCASCDAELFRALNTEHEGLSAAVTMEAMRLDYELSRHIGRARIDGEIAGLEWCLNRETTHLGTFGGARPIPEIHQRIAELRAERERLVNGT